MAISGRTANPKNRGQGIRDHAELKRRLHLCQTFKAMDKVLSPYRAEFLMNEAIFGAKYKNEDPPGRLEHRHRCALICWYCAHRPELLYRRQFILPITDDSFVIGARKHAALQQREIQPSMPSPQEFLSGRECARSDPDDDFARTD
jgi:hypothetical protein